MLALHITRRHGRHERPAPESREMPATPPPPARFWPVLDWLEARARGLALDPEYDAAMRALHAEFEVWCEQREA